jgi:hypothetical protein
MTTRTAKKWKTKAHSALHLQHSVTIVIIITKRRRAIAEIQFNFCCYYFLHASLECPGPNEWQGGKGLANACCGITTLGTAIAATNPMAAKIAIIANSVVLFSIVFHLYMK